MTVTILAAIFFGVVLLVALWGYKAFIGRSPQTGDPHTEKCSVCRSPFNKSLLIERQIGDYKILYFCPSCINSLHDEMVQKN